jgi:hypothetical protein
MHGANRSQRRRVENHRGFLLEADLEAGVVGFQLKRESNGSLVDALERADQLDANLRPQLVSRKGYPDVIQAPESGSDYRIDLSRLQYVLNVARRQYSALFVDPPAAVNRLSIDIMRQSKLVYPATTPEVASLHMVRLRCRQLKALDLGRPGARACQSL